MTLKDPFSDGIAAFTSEVRNGALTFEQATQHCLKRIDRLNPRLQAFEHIDHKNALATAAAMDQLLAAGCDLGPLMGIPIAVKDIITVEGMPVTNGSLHPTSHINGDEGSLIKNLRRAGCVILGKTKTVEFALGATGVNEARGTPWNPWDLEEHRIPGGSSSGSAVATAAGMCAFALGTDTGGSIRIPASYNGLFGHKTSMGLWPTDGVFPLSPTLDSIGPLCRSAADAMLIHQHLFKDNDESAALSLCGLRLGKPAQVFFDELDEEVQQCFYAVEKRLLEAGAVVTEIELPESEERNAVFPYIVGSELIATLGVDAFNHAKSKMDSVTAQRAAVGLTTTAEKYIRSVRRHRQLQTVAAQKFSQCDAWIAPTVPMLPMALKEIEDGSLADRALLSSRNTQLANLYGLCAVSMPMQHMAAEPSLPCGFQIMMPLNQDTCLLQISVELQKILGIGPQPDLSSLET